MLGWLREPRTLPLSEVDQERVRQFFPYPLTFEDKKRCNFPTSRWEEANRKSESEDESPGEWMPLFSSEVRVPRWLNASHPFFTGALRLRVLTPFRSNSGADGFQVEYPVPRFTFNAAIWFCEAMCAQAAFEQWRRGIPVQHPLGGLQFPKVTDDGFPIIETEEDDDGSVWATVAEPGDQAGDPAEVRKFISQFGPFVRTPFKGEYRLELISPARTPYRKDGFLIGYPLGPPKIRRVLLKAADRNRNPYQPPSTVQGSAQWAWLDRLAAGGIIDPSQPEAITGHTFLGRARFVEANGEAPRLDHLACFGGEGHRVIVGRPGSGKFTCAIAPMLLRSADRDSVFIFDIKNGEAAKETAAHRASLGPVTVLDPFGQTGMESGAINPLDLLKPDDPFLVVRAERLADAIFVPAPNSSDPFWDTAARKILVGLLIHIATSDCYAAEERNLRTLRDVVRDQVEDWVVEAMAANPAGDGEVQAVARSLREARDSDASRMSYSMLETLNVNIGFLRVPQILAATERTTFDPRQLKERVSTLYLVTPAVQFPTVSRWARLIYVYVMELLREVEGGPQIHTVLDEFPMLGKFERVLTDMALTRALGVHLHIVVQTLQHLEDTYGKGWERILGTAAVVHVLGVNDHASAEYVSKLLGTTTVRTQSRNRQRNANGGGGQSEGESFAPRALMTPDELLAMPDGEALAVIGGMKPVKLEKVAYYEGQGG